MARGKQCNNFELANRSDSGCTKRRLSKQSSQNQASKKTVKAVDQDCATENLVSFLESEAFHPYLYESVSSTTEKNMVGISKRQIQSP